MKMKYDLATDEHGLNTDNFAGISVVGSHPCFIGVHPRLIAVKVLR
jgi:hypothetical protein